MKMKFKNILSFLLLLTLLMSLSVTAFAADSGVTFENNKVTVFTPGSVYTDSDLFDGFKGVMPGDTLAETVTVTNKITDYDYIKVYLRAVLHDENGNPISENVLKELTADERRGEKSEIAYMHDFLAQLTLTVKNGSETIYSASPDQTAQLTDNVLLGELKSGESLKLDVELNVPLELGNEYADRIGEVDWVFTVEAFDLPSLTVRKVWMNDNPARRPEEIQVQLLQNGTPYGNPIALNAENQWVYVWDKLDHQYTWSAVETEVPDGYEVDYKQDGDVLVIINTGKEVPMPPAEPVDVTVRKAWSDNGKSRPDAVKVTLYNGETAVETVMLSAANDWTHTWQGLDGSGSWQVIETGVPKGYTPSYQVRDGVVIITNTATLIQTGQLNWPIPVLSALGLALMAYGIFVIFKKRKNERA